MKLILALCGALVIGLMLLLPSDARGDVLVMSDGATHDPVWVDSATFAEGLVQFAVRPLDGATRQSFPVPAASVTELRFGQPGDPQGRTADLVLDGGGEFAGVTVFAYRAGVFSVAPPGQAQSFPVPAAQITRLSFTDAAPALEEAPPARTDATPLPEPPRPQPEPAPARDPAPPAAKPGALAAGNAAPLGPPPPAGGAGGTGPGILGLLAVLGVSIASFVFGIWYLVALWREIGIMALVVFIPCIGGLVSLYFAVKYSETAGLPYLLAVLTGIGARLLAWQLGL
jgi:hypothetical protein